MEKNKLSKQVLTITINISEAATFEGLWMVFPDRVKKLVLYLGLHGFSLYFSRRKDQTKTSYDKWN